MNTEAKENLWNHWKGFNDELIKKIPTLNMDDETDSEFYGSYAMFASLLEEACEGNNANLEIAKCNKHGVIKSVCECPFPCTDYDINGNRICKLCGKYWPEQTVL